MIRNSGLTFESAASEGAILTVPNGCRKQDLRMIAEFRQYMTAHLESWYKFANVKMGLETHNGDLRLVIGCHKAPSWGMAAFANDSHTSTMRLQFRVLDYTARRSTNPACEWEYTSGHGMTEVRVGPSADDDLRTHDDRVLCNQALFLRTLNGDLSEKQWEMVHRPFGQDLKVNTQAQEGSSNGATSSSSLMPTGDRQAGSSAMSALGRSNSGSGAIKLDESDLREIYHKAELRPALKNYEVCGLCIQRHEFSAECLQIHLHPSSILNQVLLRKVFCLICVPVLSQCLSTYSFPAR